jgi:hypothetical protein
VSLAGAFTRVPTAYPKFESQSAEDSRENPLQSCASAFHLPEDVVMSSSRRFLRGRFPVGRSLLGLLLVVLAACDTPSEIENPANNPPSPLTDPQPAHNAVAVPTQPELVLAWSGGDDPDGDAVVFDVFVGSVEPLLRVGTTPDHHFSVPSQAVPPQTEVLWQIVARDDRGATTSSPIWRFGTAAEANRPPTPITAPSPADHDTAVAVNVVLHWSGGDDPEDGRTVFEVRLDTTPALGGSELLVHTGLTERQLSPGPLDSATTYYWQITARDSLGASSQSPVLSFSTIGAANRPPLPPVAPEPPDGESGVSINPELGWSGGNDPDGDPVTFHVLIDTVNPPVHVFAGVFTSTAVLVGPLQHTRTYYWQIIAEDTHGAQTTGPVWSFSTDDVPNTPPGAPHAPSPAAGAVGADPQHPLGWVGGGDPDGDAVVYDVYFGTLSPPPLVGSTASTSYMPPGGMDYDTSYFWRVVARDARGGRTSSSQWRFTTRPQNFPPSSPVNPSPTNGLVGVPVTVHLIWDECADPNGDPVVYDVYFGTGNSPVFAGTRTSASFDPPGDLAFNTTYRWRIVARDDDGGETQGPLWTFTTGSAPNHPPVAPSNPSPPNGATGLAVTTGLDWSASPDPDGDPVAYDVYFGTADPPPFVQHQAATSYDPPGVLAYGTTYHWRVVAKDLWGDETSGPDWSFTTGAAPNYPPSAPTNPSPTDGATDVALEATLAWDPASDPDGDLLSYDVFFGVMDPPPYVGIRPDPSFDPPGNLAPDTHYYWQVLTRDEHSAPVPGPIWEFTTGSGNHAPSAPSTPDPADGTTGVPISTSFAWSGGVDPDGDPVVFDLYLGPGNPPPFIGTFSSPGFDPPADLDYDTLYYWRVVARDDQGAQTSSSTWSFTTDNGPNQPPSVPQSPDPANGATGIQPDIVLTWSGGVDPDGDPVTFDVYFGDTDPPPFAATRTSPSYDPPGALQNGTDYFWRIVASDPNGGQMSGSTWRFTTAP